MHATPCWGPEYGCLGVEGGIGWPLDIWRGRAHPGCPGRCWGRFGRSSVVPLSCSKQVRAVTSRWSSSSSLGGPGSAQGGEDNQDQGRVSQKDPPRTCPEVQSRGSNSASTAGSAGSSLEGWSHHCQGTPGSQALPRAPPFPASRPCSPPSWSLGSPGASAPSTGNLLAAAGSRFFPFFAFFCLNSCTSHSRSQSQGSSLYLHSQFTREGLRPRQRPGLPLPGPCPPKGLATSLPRATGRRRWPGPSATSSSPAGAPHRCSAPPPGNAPSSGWQAGRRHPSPTCQPESLGGDTLRTNTRAAINDHGRQGSGPSPEPAWQSSTQPPTWERQGFKPQFTPISQPWDPA